MMGLPLVGIFIILALIFTSTVLFENFAFAQSRSDGDSQNYNIPYPSQLEKESVFQFYSNTEGRQEIIKVPLSELLFKVSATIDANGIVSSYNVVLDPKHRAFYQEIEKGNPSDSAFIYPLFTKAAYSPNGFYDFYRKECDTRCLTVKISPLEGGGYSSSTTGGRILELLNYTFLTDEDVDKNPDILKQYKRIIVLHNEYVTKKEFDAIMSHPNVIFLYPNALYAEVKIDYNFETITLVKGHGYPDSNVKNAFGWRGDNSKFEYNAACENWNFYTRGNKTLLNCYPEYRLLYDGELLRYLQQDDPSDFQKDLSNWIRYSDNSNTTKALLDDYDMTGKNIPFWVGVPAEWYFDGEINRVEFDNIMNYLYNHQIIR